MTFTVTIVDTTAPVIDQLHNIVEEANSLGGRVVTFTATATDVVDGPSLLPVYPHLAVSSQ